MTPASQYSIHFFVLNSEVLTNNKTAVCFQLEGFDDFTIASSWERYYSEPSWDFQIYMYCIILGGALFVSHNSIISLIEFFLYIFIAGNGSQFPDPNCWSVLLYLYVSGILWSSLENSHIILRSDFKKLSSANLIELISTFPQLRSFCSVQFALK